VIEWVNASPTDTSGIAVGFPTAAFDWNTFSWYGIYVAYKDANGASTSSVLWLRNNDGSPAYSYTVPVADGDLIGTPYWDSINETIAGVDENGNGNTTDTDVRIVYLATTAGHIIKLVDNGSSLAPPASGPWASDFTDSTVTSITSGLADDQTNLYFGGANGAAPNVYGVQIAGGLNQKTLQKTVGTVSSLTTTPSWTTSGGSTYVFLGSTASMGQSYIYRINMTSGSVNASYGGATTNINGGIVVQINHAYAVSDGGTVYSLDALNFGTGGFTNVTGFPYQTTAAQPIEYAPWVDFDGTSYFGDDGGNVYELGPTGTLAAGYPVNVSTTAKITSTPTYRQNSGVIGVGASDGYVYFIDRSAGSVFKRFFVTSAGNVSSLAYDRNISAFMVSSSDGKLVFINGADVTDPTPGST
jgi:hypothetical protein